MASLPTACFLLCLLAIVAFCVSCNGKKISCYYITPDPKTSCGEDHEPCLTLDQFASENSNESVTLILIPGHHTLYRNIEIVGVDHFSILANTSVAIQCTSPASIHFEDISNLEIRNTAIVSCGGGGSSGAVQVKSVQQFDFSNVTLQETAGVSLNVQDSNGLVRDAKFIGNTGTGMDIAKSTVVFEGNNTFSDNLDGGIASYYSTLEFIGVNQFTNNTATRGGGISAISSTINCSGNMTFEYNSAEQEGGGVYARGTRMTSKSHIRFIGNTAREYFSISTIEYYGEGGGLFSVEDSIVDFNAECDFINNSAGLGGGIGSAFNTAVNINADSNFIDNTAVAGGGVFARQARVNISRESNFINNSAQLAGGGVYAASDTTVYLRGTSNFMNNSAQQNGGGVCALSDTTVYLSGTSNFMYNSAQQYGGGVCAVSNTTVHLNGTSNFMNNSAQLDGGGVFAWSDTTVYLSGTSNFTYNSAQYGGGVCAVGNTTVHLNGTSNFMNNSAQQNGGGVFAWSDTTVYLSGISNFMFNSAQRDGGGVCAAIDTTMYLNGTSNFMYNSAQEDGGGVYAWSNTAVYLNGTSNFTYNSAQRYGGGVCAVSNTTVHLNGTSNFINNSAQQNGGGVFAWSDTTVYLGGTSNFMYNSAQQIGGGVYAANDTTMYLNGTSNFMYNSAQEDGGGVYAWSNTAVYLNGTSNFTYNSAQQDGGGVCAVSKTTVHLNGTSNFMNNSAQQNGGGVFAWSETTVYLSGTSNFMNNSAQQNGGGVFAWIDTTVYLSGTSNFTYNSAQQDCGGVCAVSNTTVHLNGTSNFMNNSAQRNGGGVFAWGDTTVYLGGTSNFMNNSAQRYGGGVCAAIDTTVYLNGTSNFMYNSARNGGGVYAWNNTTVYINGTSNFMNNSAQRYGGGVCVWSDTTVYLSGTSIFMFNSAQWDGAGVYENDAAILYISGSSKFMYNSAQRYGGAFFLQQSEVHISDNSGFTMNSASLRGGGMCLQPNSIAYIRDSVFSDNWSMHGGGVSILQSGIMLQGNTVFSNNSASYGGAIQALDAKINITGNDSFTQNLATVNGGALALAEGSVVYLILETASLTFSENIANSFGGAIFVEDNSVHCSYDWNVNGFIGFNGPTEYECSYIPDLPRCFNSKLASFKDNINISFSSNSAMAGSAIFGGEIDETVSNIRFFDTDFLEAEEYPTIGDLFHNLINVNIDDTNSGSIISSNPNRVCGCVNGQPDCSDTHSPFEVSVYPGQTVGVSLVAVGQRNGTVPSATTAMYDPDNGATFGDLQNAQRIDHPTCTELKYTIFSRKQTETFKIHVDSSCGLEGIPLSVNVTLLKCPIGFTLSNSSNQCVCEERLQKYTSNCNISNLEITRTVSDDFWVGVDNTNGTEGLILHPHCPFDYCTTDTINFTLVEGNDASLTDTHTAINASLNNTSHSLKDTNHSTSTFVTDSDTLTIATMNDTDVTDYAIGNSIDAQCNNNRSGLLCGKCQKDFSLVFGSSKCRKCSNSFLSLLIAFALAGIVLVVFLLVLKLTVAVGTINGLIFYANIVSVNRAQLFPSGETNILTVFIAWVNLDLGIETCFFDGMDAYFKAWLQYAFPVYVWVLVGAIILASRHSTRIVRSLGNNPVAVLATLFLLSYAKLLRSIINPLYVTFLDYPSHTKAVWLVDGNVNYLKGKHIPLFLSSLLALFLLFIPFTLLLLLGQWIQAQSERKCFKWISDYRVSTFLDVYHGPFKSKHRYWCGLLLVTKFCLFLVFTFNVNGDTSVNILAIAVCLIGLLTTFVLFTVYKAWYLNVLEASFIINLLLLAIGTYYVEISEGNQSALTYTSVSVAFATFCGIVVYHSCLQVKDTMLFKKLHKKLTHCLKSSADDTGAGDNEMNEIEEDPPRKYAKPPTTSVVEITH